MRTLPCALEEFKRTPFSDGSVATCARVPHRQCFGTTDPILPTVTRCGTDLIVYIQEDLYPCEHDDWLHVLRSRPISYTGLYLVLVTKA